jgi:hypothetical protein
MSAIEVIAMMLIAPWFLLAFAAIIAAILKAGGRE